MATMVGGCLLLAQGTAVGQGAPIGLTKPVQATKTNLDPGRMYSTPTFAVDPGNKLRVIAAAADLRSRRCDVMRSLDGGATWSMLEASPALASYPFCSQSQGGVIQAPMAFGRNGTVYMATGGWDDQDGARAGGAIVLSRSTNLGDTWESTLVYNTRGKTGNDAENVRPAQGLVVDTKHGSDDAVIVSFNLTKPNASAPNAEPSKPMVAVSNDGGRTFGAPINLAEGQFDAAPVRQQAFTSRTTVTLAPGATTTSTTAPVAGSRAAQPDQAANFGGSNARLAMDGKGKVYALWSSAASNITPAPPAGRYLSTSTDGGKTWQTTQTMPFGYDNANPRFAVSRDGVMHIIYQRNPKPELNGYGDIYHQASTDGGKTWSEPKILSDDPQAQFAVQVIPNISVAPNGRVDAVWWDTRDDPGTRSNDVYYSYSTDDGRTWSANRRITDQSVDRKVGVWGANYDITSPPSVFSANEFAIFGWDDTRATAENYEIPINGSYGDGTTDVYITMAQFEAVGPANNDTARIVLAAVVGLLVVGLVLLGVAVAAKRRNGPVSPTASDKPTKAKVG
ncbi:MAG TPA: sialidase family protein [Acidimicrobiales bacterium]|nr:sialidase family protein [Acidimicrobiales bacterium]